MTWLDELKRQVEASSLKIVADKLDISKATVSLLINKKYPADTGKMQKLVEGVFMGHTVNCPILGEIPKHKCAAHQNNKTPGNRPQAIQLWKACRSGCENSELEERLNVPIRLSGDMSNAPNNRPSKPNERPRLYDAQTAISRLERQARTDSEGMNGANFQRTLNELLKREIMALGSRYNRLLKQQGQ